MNDCKNWKNKFCGYQWIVTGIQLQFLNFNFKIILRKINFFVLLPPYHFTNDSTKNQYKIFHYLQLNATHTQTPYSTLSSQQQNHAPQPSRPTNQSKKKKKKKKKKFIIRNHLSAKTMLLSRGKSRRRRRKK